MFIFEIKEWVVPYFLTDGVEKKMYLRLISYFSSKSYWKLWTEVTKVLALWLCEKPLVYFSSWLEINELQTKMLVLVVDMAFEDI